MKEAYFSIVTASGFYKLRDSRVKDGLNNS